ncbi:MAG: InlB B-repeat-containing protein, partial [Coprobacillus sp.]
MIKKLFILVITLAVCLQFVGVGFQNVYAVTNNDVSTKDIAESTDLNEKITVDVVGVEGETQTDISLGTIQAPKYTGYTFVNATVDGDVINYIGTYKGEKYYANTDISNSAAYLLGDLEVKLNYTKEIKVYDINYIYDAKVMNVIGSKNVNADSNLKFRIEFNEGYKNYHVTSITANDQALTMDEDGYYVVQKIQANVEVKVTAEQITQYHVDYKDSYMGSATFTFDKTVESGKKWTGTIFSRGQNANLEVGTLNSIVLNGQYLNIPEGKKDVETRTSTLNDGTVVSVRLEREYDLIVRFDYTYTITIENVKSNLHFVPARYVDVNDVAITSIKGLDVYYWTGEKLQLLEVGDMIKKNNTTDVFFVKTKVGYEAVNVSGAGSKIIERLNTVDDIKKVAGGYDVAKAAAQAKGCNYVMYYSDSSVKHRTVNLSSQRIDYSVVYDMNDADSNAITDNQKYNAEDNKIIIVSATVPTKKGYTFTGWKNEDTNTIYKSKSEIVINEKLVNALKSNAIKLKAQWVKDEDMETSSYQVRYYFEQEDGSFTENTDYRKIIENAYIGRTVILNDLNPIGIYEFDESNINNVLKTEVYASGQTAPLKAYYALARRTLSYDKGTAVSGNVPNAKAYLKDNPAKVSGNIGNLVGPYKNQNDSQFVCWKADSTYYFANDEVSMSKDLILTPVFVGDLDKESVLNFISGENGTITGQTKFAVPSRNTFGKVILDEKALPKVTANKGYIFAGWYNVQLSTGSIANTNTELYKYVKDLNETTTIRAQFVKDDTQTHKLSYKVEYYKGDTLEDAKKSKPTDTQTVSDTVWVGDTTLALKYDN